MTQAVSAFGSLIRRGNGASPEVFTNIAEITNHALNRSLGIVDVTHHESTGRAREKIATLHDSQLTLELNWLVTSHGTLEDDHQARTLRNFQLQVPTEAAGTKTYQFSAIITQFNTTHSVDGALVGSLTLDISGPITEV